ncbi:SGNH/GDSL hydrolase family protein [Corynebacterium propinquum]|uniref:SGNH/GDSL hydrolase family protein n=1 Tax=Corynebacterium propinquum TaxID=43769 RepID=UPI00254E6E03|nr:SGNH/GDSL hydrolase family protein [Corynebacterium propinquum]MDK8665366.1 SGNH/GDSL hydrolase family protein [Corynebacterium propinquum]
MVNAPRRLRAKNADDVPAPQAQRHTQNQNQLQTQTLTQLQAQTLTRTLTRTWRRAVPAFLLSSGLVLSACSAGVDNDDDSEAASEPAIDTYVALGDSYAAMASRAGADDSGDLAADFCRRSPDNYPAVLGDLLAANTVIDRSCQGAIIDYLTATRDAGGVEVPAQLHALSETDEGATDRTVDLVTLTIGGNDIGFGEMVWCAQHALETAEPSNCGAYMDRKVEHETRVVEDRLHEIFAEIRSRAPKAQIIATGYLPLLGAFDDCAEIAAISGPDRTWLQTVIQQLNQAVAQAAQAYDVQFVLPAEADKHTVCAEPNQRWVDLSGTATGSFPFHPTAAGQAAMAQEIYQRIRRD